VYKKRNKLRNVLLYYYFSVVVFQVQISFFLLQIFSQRLLEPLEPTENTISLLSWHRFLKDNSKKEEKGQQEDSVHSSTSPLSPPSL